MNQVNMDSFIDFCDDYQVAEESRKEMNTILRKEVENLNRIKEEIKKNHGNPKKQATLYDEAIKNLQSVKNTISSMDDSTFDKFKDGCRAAVSVAIPIITTVGSVMLARKANNALGNKPGKHNIGAGAAGLIGGGVGSFLLNNSIDYNKIKKIKGLNKSQLVNLIDRMIDELKECKEIIQNPKYSKYFTNDDKKSYDDNIRDSVDKYGKEKLKPLYPKIFNLAKKKFMECAKKRGLEIIISQNMDGSAYLKSRKGCIDDCYRIEVEDKNQKSGVGTDEYYDAYEEFADIVYEIRSEMSNELKKFKKETDMNVEFKLGDGDDETFTFTVYCE